MRRLTLYGLSIAIGYFVALWVAQHDARLMGYGPSDFGTGGDPLALMVWLGVALILGYGVKSLMK